MTREVRAEDGGGPIRVVLADDEAMLRRGLRVLLEGDDTIRVVAEAGNGDELLAKVRAHRPDVALIDVQMPGKDGLTALRDLGALPDPPVAAVLTTFDLDDYVSDALRFGANGFLLKDADPAVLVRLLPRFRSVRDNTHEMHLVRGLSGREQQVLHLLGDGRSNADIGARLGLTEATVKSYVSTVLSKLGAQNRVQAALIAQRVAGDAP
ncbi:response regulator transcription factor [Saccharopolyspora soli]|uniref:response regulator transcription factor n=1 Tax=Saccharopolyspora soli TaxID=2926618 RepID=UPI0027E062A0|nr:response regulator transcription factor [Saccharopolyspora soli]